MARRERYVVGLDVGTSAVVCIVGETLDDGSLDIVGLGVAESRGIKRGVGVNLEGAVDSIQKAIEGAGWKVLAIAAAKDRRHVGSGADRLDDAPEPSTRPGMTDRLTLEQMLGEIRAFADGFPADLRTALDLWMADVDYPEIAQRVGVPDAAEARALVRAAQARLRAKFRGAWPEWFGA